MISYKLFLHLFLFYKPKSAFSASAYISIHKSSAKTYPAPTPSHRDHPRPGFRLGSTSSDRLVASLASFIHCRASCVEKGKIGPYLPYCKVPTPIRNDNSIEPMTYNVYQCTQNIIMGINSIVSS